MKNKEVFVPVKGFETAYLVSNYGRIKSLNYFNSGKEGFLSPEKDKYGYPKVTLFFNKKAFYTTVHREMAKAFLPNPDNLPCVNHKDEIRDHNFIWVNEDGTIDFEKSNLEWCSWKHNTNWGSCLEKRAIKKRKAVAQYSLSGEIIAVYPSVKAAAATVGCRPNQISACLTGKQKTTYGYIWKYL